MNRVCGTNGEKRNAYRIFVGKPEEKRQLRRLRRRLADNIVARQRLDRHFPSATNTHAFRVNNAYPMNTKTGLTQSAQQRLRTQ
jgi:hypothetical protein